jgi:hypothetical protein
VATNFGNYVGDGYYVPPAFFMSEDFAAAERMLQERKTRYLAIHFNHERRTPSYIQVACPQIAGRYIRNEQNGGVSLLAPWTKTVGHKLTRDGYSQDSRGQSLSGPLQFLRLIHVSPFRVHVPGKMGDRSTDPAGYIWEYVQGAQVVAAGQPGEKLTVTFTVRYKKAQHTLTYLDTATVGANGIAQLRVPYATVAPNGDGEPGTATWQIGSRRGRLAITERAVMEGRTVQLK